MRNIIRWAGKFFRSEAPEGFGPAVRTEKKRFRWQLVFMMTGVSMIPLILVSCLSYMEYSAFIEKESESHIRWDAAQAKNTIDTFLQELQLVMVVFAKDLTINELSDRKTVSKIFRELKQQFDGIIDVGVIDPSGIQQVYAGPFGLLGKDYSDQPWFHKAVTRHSYVSTIFTGCKYCPHFVIAVSKTIPSGEDYRVLRVTVDAEVLDKFIAGINAKKSYHDVFIVDHSGKRQTSSHYGAVGDMHPIHAKPDISGITVTRETHDSHTRLLQATAQIRGSPWVLVLVQGGFGPVLQTFWETFRYKLITIVVGCAFLILIVTYRTVNLFMDKIYLAYESRDAAVGEAEHAAKLASIGRLAAGVAHEINNPLAIVDQKAGLAKDLLELTGDFKNKEKIGSQIDSIHEAVNRCKVITYRLLGFARRMDVSPEEIDINGLLEEVLSFLEKEALYKHIQIDLDLSETLPRIFSDRGKLQQIFLNIVNNAIDAIGGEGGGRILITSMRKDEDMVRVAIKDNGPGIPPHIIKHIFGPFFTTKEPGKGTGLGLSITYGLVKKLGGTISVDSTLGEGATFVVDLPIGGSIQ